MPQPTRSDRLHWATGIIIGERVIGIRSFDAVGARREVQNRRSRRASGAVGADTATSPVRGKPAPAITTRRRTSAGSSVHSRRSVPRPTKQPPRMAVRHHGLGKRVLLTTIADCEPRRLIRGAARSRRRTTRRSQPARSAYRPGPAKSNHVPRLFRRRLNPATEAIAAFDGQAYAFRRVRSGGSAPPPRRAARASVGARVLQDVAGISTGSAVATESMKKHVMLPSIQKERRDASSPPSRRECREAEAPKYAQRRAALGDD